MATQVQTRRGSTAEHSTFTGAVGELTVDTTKDTVVVHDGSTAGGAPLLREDGSNSALALGSAASPSLKFTGDTNTGIYSPGADQLALSTNGTGRLFVDASGNVGVGTATPVSTASHAGLTLEAGSGAQLDLKSTGASDRNFFIKATSGGTVFLNNGASQPFIFRQDVTERLRITSTGLVGIGTSSPNQLLDVRGNSNPQLKISETNNSTSAGLFIENQGQRNWQLWADRSTDTFRLGNNSRATTNITVSSAGNVGIGTTSPTQPLQVAGNALIGGSPAGQWSTLTVAGDSAIQAAAPIFNFVNAAGSARFAYINHSGTGGDLYLLNQEAGALRLGAGNFERARIDSSGRLLVGTSSARANFYNASSSPVSQVEGTDNNGSALSIVQNFNGVAGNGAQLFLGRSDGSALGSNTLVPADRSIGRVSYQANDGTEFVEAARIEALVDGTPGANDMPGRLVFSTTADGASSPTERMRITQAGNINIATAGSEVNVSTGSTDGATFYGATGTVNGIIQASNNTAPVALFRRRTNDGGVIIFYRDTTGVGSISVTTTATAYNTSSDYRLKENVTAVTDGITRLRQLKPSRFNFIADPDKTVDGFLAHEVQSIVPEAITGEKDAVDDEGNPQYQGIDQSKLVPLLTAALQEAIGEIESLKARVAALEAN